MTPFPIETPRLILVPAQAVHLQAALVGREELERYIGFSVHPEWTEFGNGPWAFALERLQADEREAGWWTWFPVLKSEELIIGTCGYKGLPNEAHQVEIGYEIAPPFRGQGLATECALGLVDRVRQMDVISGVQAHTLAEENASASILRKLGFAQTGEFIDPDDGPVWSWLMNLDQ
ncbi:MAG: GNAT family N-acetyltransferase [Saprospiraceae bacterium]|nr:GNAT family N-acetyltransferase [Saprospiraceae bacterium]